MAILDFAKAFDKVPHERLLKKLDHYGIRGGIHRWVRNFLTGRTQRVVCEGAASEPKPVISGVPLGTVTGPLWFLLFINDLPANLCSTARLFADDCVLYTSSKTPEKLDSLQDDLFKLEAWQETWSMKFNPSKCSVMQITLKKDRPDVNYTFCGEVLQETASHPYLGVQIDNNLSWKTHIKMAVSKASRILGFLKRNIWFTSQATKAAAYKTLVRPILEYASSVWDPYRVGDKKLLERIQRKAARFCLKDYQQRSSVSKMLEQLEWETLEGRRKNNRLSMMYKIMNNMVGIHKEQLLTMSSEKRTRGSHQHKILKMQGTKDIYMNSFFPRTASDWNQLPGDITEAATLNTFKNKLRK
jgi:hypothetical protein